MPTVIRMTGEDGAGAVELLGEDEAGEGMSQSQGSKREQELSPRAGAFGPSAGRAHGKNDVLRALIAALGEPGGESFGRHLASAAVEQNGKRGRTSRTAVDPLEERLFGAERHSLAGVIYLDSLAVPDGETVKLVPGCETGRNMSQCQPHDPQNSANGWGGGKGRRKGTELLRFATVFRTIIPFFIGRVRPARIRGI